MFLLQSAVNAVTSVICGCTAPQRLLLLLLLLM
jgi:hypothetical protein